MKCKSFLIMFFTLFSCLCICQQKAIASPENQTISIGVVSFEECMEKSKYGINKQNSYEAMRRQMTEILEKNNQELENTEAKVSDSDYLDGLTPKAVEQLKLKLQNLYQERSKFEQQFYQAISQGHNQLWNSMLRIISKASELIGKEHSLSIVLNEINAFYFAPSLNITGDVIVEMDRMYEEEMGQATPPVETSPSAPSPVETSLVEPSSVEPALENKSQVERL